MAKLSRSACLAILGSAGVVALMFFLNYYSGLNWFGGYDFYAMLGGLVLVLIAVPFVAPSEQSK